MKTYTRNTDKISVELPKTWDFSQLTDVTLQISDVAGNETMASTSCELYTPTTVASSASRFDKEVYLDIAAEDLKPGDSIRLVGINGYEDHIVKGYDSINKIVIFEIVLDRDFEDGSQVYRTNTSCDVDFSSTTTYPAGIQLVLTWEPAGTGNSFTSVCEVEGTKQPDTSSFYEKLRALYPRAYDGLISPTNIIATIYSLAQDEVRMIFTSRGLDISRVVDQELLTPVLLHTVARLWCLNGDAATKDEFDKISTEQSNSIERLLTLPIWQDTNRDKVQQTEEVQDRPHYFEKAW